MATRRQRKNRRGGRRQNSIRADHLRRAKGLSTFWLLDYWSWPRRRLHSPRTERMTEKSAVTSSAKSMQMKKKPPPRLLPKPMTPRYAERDPPFLTLAVHGRCRSKKAQITAGPFGSLGAGPNNRG
jgi:hypothetical protein